MPHLLIIGGSDAGISAGLRARELDPSWEVTLVVADAYPNFSICGLPFFISGETPDWRSLAHRTIDEIEREGVRLLLNHTATAIDAGAQRVAVVDPAGAEQQVAYDKLVIGTGARPARPAIAGVELAGVYALHTMEDSFRVHRHVTEDRPRSAAIVGSGYIGLELADALAHRGLDVTLLVRSEHVFRTAVDPALGDVVEEELTRQGVRVLKGAQVDGIRRHGEELFVEGPGLSAGADMVLAVTGVQPASELGAAAGIPTGIRGALRVNRRMETGLPHVYAAGDCVETWHRLAGDYTYLPLGTTAHKQGRVAGENAVGGDREFQGSVGTQVVKVFDLAVARSGLRDAEAAAAGFDPLSVDLRVWDHKVYYPGARELLIRLTGDRRTGRLLGGQMVGHWQGQVAKRIDIVAGALFHGMAVESLNDLDLSYTPPFSSPWDPVQMAAQAWSRARGAETDVKLEGG